MTKQLRHIYFGLIILNSFMLTGCSLSENPTDQVDEEQIYTSSKAI